MNPDNNSLGLDYKPTSKTAKKAVAPHFTVARSVNTTLDDLYRLTSSAEFKELERAVRTVRAAQKALHNLPAALKIVSRHQ